MITNRPPRPAFYRPELDLLRFAAFAMVFAHHKIAGTTLGAMCSAGLQIFFLLSAYLITELLLREREETGSVHVAAFFQRRMLRIWPLYFAAIGGAVLLGWLFHRPFFPAEAILPFLLLAGNWYTYANGFFNSPLAPLWSISIEEQFYLVWPFIARFGGRVGLWITSAAAYLAAFITLYLLGGMSVPRSAVWTHSLVEFQFFAIGGALALILHRRAFALQIWQRLILASASISLLYLAVAKLRILEDGLPFSRLAPSYLLYGAAAAGLFLSVLGMPVSPKWRPILFLGKISYGLYVFHEVAMDLIDALTPLKWLRAPLAFATTIAFATLSYHLLERPFLRLKKRFEHVASRAA